jgi:hypothetical protein
MRIKVDSELDRLRGEFRKKENEIVNPMINRYNILEQKVETCLNIVYSKTKEYENSLLLQE